MAAAMPSIVSPDRVPPQPWRNGGGVTRELFAWPPTLDWQVRVSVADIARDGRFSELPEVDRWFTVVQGGGVALRFGGRRETLGTGSGPLRFRGSEPPWCELLDGATRALNLMVRRRAGQASMRRLNGGAWTDQASLRAVFTAGALHLQTDDAPVLALAPFSLAWSTGAADRCWRLRGAPAPVRAWAMTFVANPDRCGR
jgi:uncharacterized protein